MANWNDLLNSMSRIAFNYATNVSKPVFSTATAIGNLPKRIPVLKPTMTTGIKLPATSNISAINRTINKTVLSLPTYPVYGTNILSANRTQNISSNGMFGNVNITGLSNLSFLSPNTTQNKLYNTTGNRTITNLTWGNTTPAVNASFFNTTPAMNASVLVAQNTLPTVGTIPTTIYKPSGGFMALGPNKWGNATIVGTGYYKNTRVNNQVDYGTLYKTDKGAWYLVTPRGQVIQSGGAGSLSAIPKLQLRKQKYNRIKNVGKIAYNKTKNKIKINKKKYRGARK